MFLIEFRKRPNDEIMIDIKGMIIEYNTLDDPGPENYGGSHCDETALEKSANCGIIIFDTICVPQNISYPQDVNLLNEVRENLERMIDVLCYEYGYYNPRIHRKNVKKGLPEFCEKQAMNYKKDSQGH